VAICRPGWLQSCSSILLRVYREILLKFRLILPISELTYSIFPVLYGRWSCKYDGMRLF
jgi:hypothetical protein